MDVHKLLRRVEDLRAADGVAESIGLAVRRVLRGKPGIDRVLRGSWLGHPVHPVAVTVPIGAWVCAAVLDLTPGNRDAARKLVAIGLAATAPAVALGLADYTELDVRQRRVGLTHALSNMVGAGLLAASYRRRRAGGGRLLTLLGLSVVGAGGALGGHLSYSQGAGVYRWQTPAPTRKCATRDADPAEVEKR
jgi:uncharacterized membrane protein